jgi:hypothetical protein
MDVDVAQLAERHAGLGRVRRNLITETGNVELVDTYLTRRLTAALGKFGEDYVGEMSARIDRVFELRNKLSGQLDALIGGESVHVEMIKQMFGDLSREMDQLTSPTKALETQKLELPHEPPQPAPARETTQQRPSGTSERAPPRRDLRQIATTPTTREGLQIVERQSAAPELKEQIASVAQRFGPDMTRDLLTRIARFLTPENTQELQGLSHFLAVAEHPRSLVRLLSPGETFEWTADVRSALRTIRDFSPEAVQGVRVLFASGKNTAATALRIFHNFQREPALVGGVFESLARLESRSHGLDSIISSLASNDPNHYKGAQGHLLSANQLLDRYPDASLLFEAPSPGPDGRLRFSDIEVRRPGEIPIRVEAKFYTTLKSIGADTRDQLARDVVEDARLRHQFPRSDGSLQPPFATVVWRFERVNLASELAQLGRSIGDAELKSNIKTRLQQVFKEHETLLRQELGGEFEAYQTAFESLPFVEFY